jgi:hypothetical protein
LFDESSRDLRREESVSGGDDADRREEFDGEGVLKEETARPSAQSSEDVFVEIECG